MVRGVTGVAAPCIVKIQTPKDLLQWNPGPGNGNNNYSVRVLAGMAHSIINEGLALALLLQGQSLDEG